MSQGTDAVVISTVGIEKVLGRATVPELTSRLHPASMCIHGCVRIIDAVIDYILVSAYRT
jgi:hypothetical protein